MKLKNKTIYSVIFISVLFCLFGLTACSSGIVDYNKRTDGATGFVRFSICENGEQNDFTADKEARTVFPYAGVLDGFRMIKLSYEKSYSEEIEIGAWDKYSDFESDSVVAAIPVGTYTFKLTGKRFGTTFTQQKSATVVADTTVSLVFDNLTVSSGNTGKVSIDLKLPSSITSQIDDIKATIINMDTDEDENYGLVYDTEEDCISFINENIKQGDNLLMIKITDSENNQLFYYTVAIQVKAGFESSASFDYSGDNDPELIQLSHSKKNKITYYANYDDQSTEKYVQTYYPGCSILGIEATGFSLAGKTFQGWNTNKAGTGYAFAANDDLPWNSTGTESGNISVMLPYGRGDLKLYAQWSD